jgi:hypothetical protein
MEERFPADATNETTQLLLQQQEDYTNDNDDYHQPTVELEEHHEQQRQLQQKRNLRNFCLMSVFFASNPCCVLACMALATARLGTIGAWQSYVDDEQSFCHEEHYTVLFHDVLHPCSCLIMCVCVCGIPKKWNSILDVYLVFRARSNVGG